MSTPHFRVSVLSKVGGRERNEDACGYWAGAGSTLACYVLADGAGGHGGGDVASRVAVQAVLDRFAQQPDASAISVMRLLQAANESVISEQASDRRLADMRSTLVLLQIDARRHEAFWGHVGDSRLYCFRKGRIAIRTKDHSLLQNMIDAGMVKEVDAPGAPDRNVLTGSLGGEDCFAPTATDSGYPFEEGSAFLLCSDGFWGLLEDQEMESGLRGADSPEAWLRNMESSIAARLRPGADNYSAIALWYGDEDERTRVLPPGAASSSGAAS